ncbi:MAG: lipid-A-disaccharide synthase [Halioglobus sp.]
MSDSRLRIGVLAGEASGDILGARLLIELRKVYPELIVEGIGGPMMEAQGMSSLFPMDRLSVIGLVEPLKRLPELLRIRGAVYEHFRCSPPDVFLGIDSPDFTLHLEQKLKRIGIPTAHLVSPTVWAWRSWRIRKIKRAVDLMLCLFPFETSVYARHDIPAEFVGHPLADEIDPSADRAGARAALEISPDSTVLALLPGSRSGEVARLLPHFLETLKLLREQHPTLEALVPAASAQRRQQIDGILAAHSISGVRVLDGDARQAMTAADAVLLASGTATLEAALLQRPMVVAYRMSALSFAIMYSLATTSYVSLPNILLDSPVIPEFFQNDVCADRLAPAVSSLLGGGRKAEEQQEAFASLHASLSLNYAHRAVNSLLGLIDRKKANDA